MKSFLVAVLLATGLEACQRQRHFHNVDHRKRSITPRQALTDDEALIISTFDAKEISDWSYYYTHGAHVAGTNRSQAQWTADRFSEAGWVSRIDTYNVFLNYPINKSMTLTFPDGSVYTPSLEEDVLEKDPTTSYPNRIPTFHGFSASGVASAELVYVGLGQQDDFQRLSE
jgi:N-acetylated-alpha-linked acidic dipeptidase